MTLASDIKSIVSESFKAFEDLRKTVTYYSVTGDTVYDPVADTVSADTENVTIQGIWSKFSKFQIINQVALSTDVKFIVPALDLGGIIPNENDYLVDDSGVRWNVYGVRSPPGESVYILHLRES